MRAGEANEEGGIEGTKMRKEGEQVRECVGATLAKERGGGWVQKKDTHRKERGAGGGDI